MADQPADMPEPRRRRVADPTRDPMASPAPAPVTATIPPVRSGRRRAGEPTVSVFLRTEVATKWSRSIVRQGFRPLGVGRGLLYRFGVVPGVGVGR